MKEVVYPYAPVGSIHVLWVMATHVNVTRRTIRLPQAARPTEGCMVRGHRIIMYTIT